MAAAAINIECHELGLPQLNADRLDLYYMTRTFSFGSAAANQDTGTVIPDMLKVMQTQGVAPETDRPYTISTFQNAPSQQALTDAAQHTITGFVDYHEPAAMNYRTIRGIVAQALDQGHMVMIGFTAKSWYGQEHGTIDTLNPNNDPQSSVLGGHAGLIVGMDDSLCGGRGGYIVQNSWGTGVGDNGNMVIPYDEFPGGNTINGQYTINLFSLDILTGYQGHDQSWTAERTAVSNVYIELFGRSADIAGLDYWAAQYKAGMSIAAIAQTFNQSPEFTSTFGNLTTSQKINQLYVNAFGHQADAAGLSYWTSQVTDAASLAQTEQNIINGAQGGDITALANKNDVSMYFSATSQLNDLTEARHVMNFNPLDAAAMQVMKMGIPHDMGWI
jgi:hypothetical protein